jgi:hypothetical protein
MTELPLSAALKELVTRNELITAAYRDWGRRLPPGPVSRLAASMTEQRLDLGTALGEIPSIRVPLELEVEFELAPAAAAGYDAPSVTALEPKDLLRRMAEAEAAEHELLAALAGAILPSSTEAAELIAAQAAAAGKRSLWARDQLELLSL